MKRNEEQIKEAKIFNNNKYNNNKNNIKQATWEKHLELITEFQKIPKRNLQKKSTKKK